VANRKGSECYTAYRIRYTTPHSLPFAIDVEISLLPH
jgi:hypothetical protein